MTYGPIIVTFVLSIIGIFFLAIVASVIVDRIGATAYKLIDYYWEKRCEYVTWVSKMDLRPGYDSTVQ